MEYISELIVNYFHSQNVEIQEKNTFVTGNVTGYSRFPGLLGGSRLIIETENIEGGLTDYKMRAESRYDFVEMGSDKEGYILGTCFDEDLNINVKANYDDNGNLQTVEALAIQRNEDSWEEKKVSLKSHVENGELVMDYVDASFYGPEATLKTRKGTAYINISYCDDEMGDVSYPFDFELSTGISKADKAKELIETFKDATVLEK